MVSIKPTTGNSAYLDGPAEMPAGIGASIEATRPVVETITAMQSQALDNVAALSLHWSNFVSARTQENIKLSKQLTECKLPEDFHAAVSDYWKTATTHYQTTMMNATAAVMKTKTADDEAVDRLIGH